MIFWDNNLRKKWPTVYAAIKRHKNENGGFRIGNYKYIQILWFFFFLNSEVQVRPGGLERGITHPKATAPAIASPKAADFPRPLAAVSATVLLRVFSEMASMNFRTAFAWGSGTPPGNRVWVSLSCPSQSSSALASTPTWSRVLQPSTSTPTGCVSCRLSFSSLSSKSWGRRLSSCGQTTAWAKDTSAQSHLWGVFWHLWAGRERELEGKVTTGRMDTPNPWEFLWTDIDLTFKFPGDFRRIVPQSWLSQAWKVKHGRILQYIIIREWHCKEKQIIEKCSE